MLKGLRLNGAFRATTGDVGISPAPFEEKYCQLPLQVSGSLKGEPSSIDVKIFLSVTLRDSFGMPSECYTLL